MSEWWKDYGVAVPKWAGRGCDLKQMVDEAERVNKKSLGLIRSPPCGACKHFLPSIAISPESAAEHGFTACHGPRQERDFSCFEDRESGPASDDGWEWGPR